MAEIGPGYMESMADDGVVGSTPALHSFSSVSGEVFAPTSNNSGFGPGNWQANLENPVLFTSAVGSASRQHTGLSKQILLEIGPRSALAGPLRQIFTHNSSSASYIPTLARRTDSIEGWLSALGHLHVRHFRLNLQRLMPTGDALSDLPPYP